MATDRTVLVDTNVIFDFLSEDSEWFDWSASMLGQAANDGFLAINPIIYGELSVRFDRVEDVEAAVPANFFARAALPWEAAFLAAKAYQRYRRLGGTRTAPLPDFYIGAHAAVTGMTLLTRDGRRYREYFPKLKMIAP